MATCTAAATAIVNRRQVVVDCVREEWSKFCVMRMGQSGLPRSTQVRKVMPCPLLCRTRLLSMHASGMAAQLAQQAAADRAANLQRQRQAAQKRKADKVIWVEMIKNKAWWCQFGAGWQS